MVGTIIGLIILVVFLGVLFWAGQRLMPLIPMAEPFRTILYVLVVVLVAVLVIYVLLTLLGGAGIHVPFFGAVK